MSLESDYQKALVAAGNPEEAIASASKTVASTKWGEEAYHEAHSVLFKGLEAGLRNWVKANPPGTADYTFETPMRAVWLYRDTLEGIPGTEIRIIDGLLTRVNFPKLVKKTLSSMKGKSASGEKDRIAERYPEYRQLLKDIAEAKKIWKADDVRIRTTHAFRMMGGLARMGTAASSRYHSLVREAHRLEKSVLGKTLTKETRV